MTRAIRPTLVSAASLVVTLALLVACETGPVETGPNPPPPPSPTPRGLEYGPSIGLDNMSGEASEADAERFEKQDGESEKQADEETEPEAGAKPERRQEQAL